MIYELDIPPVQVKFPSNLIASTVNLNDDIQFEVEHNQNQNIVSYNLLLIYNFEVVGIHKMLF
jgi:hypothetical protein